MALPLQAASLEAGLRSISRRTSHHRSRLTFHPLAQFTRALVSQQRLRASTRLSPRFTLTRPGSTGFGSCRGDSTPVTTRPLTQKRCGLLAFAATPQQNWLVSPRRAHSLPRFSIRMTEHRSTFSYLWLSPGSLHASMLSCSA